VGYAHGAVAETLGAIYPEGRVEKGDAALLAKKLADILGKRTSISDNCFLLHEMVRRTINLYQEETLRGL
jgi:hypothetical protein